MIRGGKPCQTAGPLFKSGYQTKIKAGWFEHGFLSGFACAE